MYGQHAVEDEAQGMDGVGQLDDNRTDVEAHVELFEVNEFRFGAKPDKFHLVLVQLKSLRRIIITHI